MLRPCKCFITYARTHRTHILLLVLMHIIALMWAVVDNALYSTARETIFLLSFPQLPHRLHCAMNKIKCSRNERHKRHNFSPCVPTKWRIWTKWKECSNNATVVGVVSHLTVKTAHLNPQPTKPISTFCCNLCPGFCEGNSPLTN